MLAHRSTATLEALGDAVRTGPTRTNVDDLFVAEIGGDGAGQEVAAERSR